MIKKTLAFLKSLNREDYIYGAVYGLAPVFLIGIWAALTTPICAMLWAIGGDERFDKAYRRIGCPAIICAPILFVFWIGALLAGLATHGTLRIGYGLPTIAPGRPDDDPGSALGRFFWRLAKGDEKKAHLYTRTAYMAIALTAYYAVFVISKSIL